MSCGQDNPNPNSPEDGPVTSAEHHAIAAELAAKGMVLLKNDGDFLPIRLPSAAGGSSQQQQQPITIALIGHEALGTTVGGGGSGGVNPSNFTTPKDLIRRRAGISGAGDCTLDGGVCVKFQNVQEEADIDLARKLAQSSTHVFVFVATDSMEGADRDNLSLASSCQTDTLSDFGLPVCDNSVQHEDQDALINRVVEVAGERTAVIAVTPGALLTPWAEQTAAVLISFMPGQGYAEGACVRACVRACGMSNVSVDTHAGSTKAGH
jgi:beta-glucosidase